MKKLILVVGIVLLASTAYAQNYMRQEGETLSEAFERAEREERQAKLERSQLRLNMMMEERLSQPQQYQIRRNGNTLVIEEY